MLNNKSILPFLLALLLLAPGRSFFAQQPSFHLLLKGKVLEEGGKPVMDVAVTDGTNIVYTDAKGEYTLQSTRNAAFVYISIPAGYEIPAQDGLPLFYKKIPHQAKVVTANFYLKKLNRSDNHHYAVVWADPQINTQAQADSLLQVSVPDTRQHVQELTKIAPVHGIAAGDLIWDAPAILPQYKKAIKAVGIPFFQVLGNHDMDIHVRSDEQSDSTFHKAMGPGWYSFNRGQAHYIVLDNVFYYSDGYNYIGYISEQQFRWMEQDLSKVKPGSLVFVSMHIPAYTKEKEWYKLPKENIGNVTVNRSFLYQLLKPFKAHLLTGHTHYNENREEGGVYEHIHGALCGSWWTTPYCEDGTPAGYGVYEIKGNNVTWYYKPVGYTKEDQFRLYNRGVYKNKPADIAVNVWNWDAAWKVEWYEDDVFKGSMRQEVDVDPVAVQLMQGADKPGKYAWIEPRLTPHLFFATPSSGAEKIRVEVTDRFGAKYSQEQVLIPAKSTQ